MKDSRLYCSVHLLRYGLEYTSQRQFYVCVLFQTSRRDSLFSGRVGRSRHYVEKTRTCLRGCVRVGVSHYFTVYTSTLHGCRRRGPMGSTPVLDVVMSVLSCVL